MSYIQAIEQKILQLDAGSFQNLCNSYLFQSRSDFENIVCLGSQSGTNKPTKGTPDTYFIKDNKYIFVEYTTQINDLYKKIIDDINKCLDVSKTGISHDMIEEIIYCHISSNITPFQHDELKKMCTSKGIKFTIIGINQLAYDLYNHYPDIIKECLDISISTMQILSYKGFIQKYNKSITVAPLYEQFLFRENEILELDNLFKTNDIVILKGKAGVGKTRLALEYGRNYSKNNNRIFYCIFNREQDIINDLYIYINKNNQYVVFIDDANELTKLVQIIDYLMDYDVKVIITVRDYALNQIRKNLYNYQFKELFINHLDDNQIKEILKENLNITNNMLLERIIKISGENPRLAVLAGKFLVENPNSLDTITDATSLYDKYYSYHLSKYFTNYDIKTYISAGLCAFLGTINLDKLDYINNIKFNNISFNSDDFEIGIHNLNRLEIVDIYRSKIVKFSDQCLSNYFLKYIFYNKKYISFSSIIEVLFNSKKDMVIFSINVLINIFYNKDIFQYVKNEVLQAWQYFKQQNPNDFWEFVKAFSNFNVSETLSILVDKISTCNEVIIPIEELDTTNKNNNYVSDEILQVLGSLHFTGKLSMVLDCFFEYYSKRPDLYAQFYNTANNYYGIIKTEYGLSYYNLHTFLEKISQYSNNWNNDFIITLFLDLAPNFLRLCQQVIEKNSKKGVTLYYIALELSPALENCRKNIWEFLLEISNKKQYHAKIKKIVSSYTQDFEESNYSIIQFDYAYMKEIIKIVFDYNNLNDCIALKSLICVLETAHVELGNDFSRYLSNEYYKIYNIFEFSNKWENVQSYLDTINYQEFCNIIDMCKYLDNSNLDMIQSNISKSLDYIFKTKDYSIQAVEYYIQCDTPNNIVNPIFILNFLFSKLEDTEVINLIDKYTFTKKSEWYYAYFHELPQQYITNEHLIKLYEFFKNTSGNKLLFSTYCDLNFLKKYLCFDEDIFINISRIILSKQKEAPLITNIYFDILFYGNLSEIHDVLLYFKKDYNLLKEIYYNVISNRSIDYNGKFLKEFYLVYPDVLEVCIDNIVNINYKDLDNMERYVCLFELDNFLEIFDFIVNSIMDKCKNVYLPTISERMEKLLIAPQNNIKIEENQHKWIVHYIKEFAIDIIKMEHLFDALLENHHKEKKNYILLFLEHNNNIDDFKKLDLYPLKRAFWHGELCDIYNNEISLIQELFKDKLFNNLKYLNHQRYLEDKIDYLKERIEINKLEEIMYQ